MSDNSSREFECIAGLLELPQLGKRGECATAAIAPLPKRARIGGADNEAERAVAAEARRGMYERMTAETTAIARRRETVNALRRTAELLGVTLKTPSQQQRERREAKARDAAKAQKRAAREQVLQDRRASFRATLDTYRRRRAYSSYIHPPPPPLLCLRRADFVL